MKKLLILFLLYITFGNESLNAQIFSEQDVEVCRQTFQLAVDKNLSELPVNEVIIEIGKSFIGTNYEAFALEREGEEELVIHLRGLDCTTFIENALVFSRLVKKGDTTFSDYIDELKLIRYRNGIINGYPSRLHYFSDWIFDNEQKGIIEDVTKVIGGEPIKFDLDFMSTNPEYYMQLKDNPEFVKAIRDKEEEINNRVYYYIPQNKIYKVEDKIKSGYLIGITTSVEGLDIGHTGIAIKLDDGRIHFLHAPSKGKKVQITDQPLPDYIKSIDKHTGIIVLRPQKPCNN